MNTCASHTSTVVQDHTQTLNNSGTLQLLRLSLTMSTEKALILIFLLSVTSVGILMGTAFLTYKPTNTQGNTNSGKDAITLDTDLLDLALEVPDWTFLMSDDSLLSIRNYEGKYIVADLMATWCSSCAQQNTNLKALDEELGDSILIISLSVDNSDTISMMAEYKESKGLTWPHGLDTGGSFTNYFDIRSVPTLVIIDDAGYFRWIHVGIWDTDDMIDTLSVMMAH